MVTTLTLAPDEVQLVIRSEFFPEGSVPGIMVDVGAARPNILSNSAGYRKLGWRVISIEPNPIFCSEHRQFGFDVLEYACSNEDKDDVDFFTVDLTGRGYRGAPITYEAGSSLGMPDYYAARLQNAKGLVGGRATIKVKVRKLDTILEEHAPDLREIDVLSVVTGEWELAVFAGFSLDRYKPKIIILDNVAADNSRTDFLSPRGYWLWDRFSPKEIYVRSEWRAHFE